MSENAIFYFPYATFQDEQIPLLKATALYFDKLYVLDPLRAGSYGPARGEAARAVRLLSGRDVGILERIAPEDVLHRFEQPIARAIQDDLADQAFVDLCETSGRNPVWELALAKVPASLRDRPEFRPIDESMRRVLKHFSESAYEELTDVGGDQLEFRFALFPLAVGEAVMMNHALFASLLHTGATPLTDDVFHSQVLRLKLTRARAIPELRAILDDPNRVRQLRKDEVGLRLLTDRELALPAVSPKVSAEDVLELRRAYADELGEARAALGRLARKVRAEPWTADFADALEHELIPGVQETLDRSRKARDSWLRGKRGTAALKLAGLTLGAAAAAVQLMFIPEPVLSVATATAVAGFVGDHAVPLAESIREHVGGTGEDHGLHFLLRTGT